MSYIGKTPTSVPLTSSDITDGIITLPKLTDGTDGNIISYDASGNPVAVATGTDGQVLTSTGAGSPPAFETLPAGETNAPSFRAFMNGNQVIANATTTTITYNAEEYDTASAYNTSTYTYTVPSGEGGKYIMTMKFSFENSADFRQIGYFKVNGSEARALQTDHDTTDNGFIQVSLFNLNAGDAIRCDLYQDQGGGQTLIGSSVWSEFSGFKISS